MKIMEKIDTIPWWLKITIIVIVYSISFGITKVFSG